MEELWKDAAKLIHVPLDGVALESALLSSALNKR